MVPGAGGGVGPLRGRGHGAQVGHVGVDPVPATGPDDGRTRRTERAPQPGHHHAQPLDGALVVVPQVGGQHPVRDDDAAGEREPHQQTPLQRASHHDGGVAVADLHRAQDPQPQVTDHPTSMHRPGPR